MDPSFLAHRALMNTMNSQHGLPVSASCSIRAHSHWGAQAGPAAGHVASCRPAPLAMRPPRGPPGDGVPRGRERRAWSVAAVEGRAQGSSGWRPGGRGAADASGSNPSAARRSAASPSSTSGGDLSQNGPVAYLGWVARWCDPAGRPLGHTDLFSRPLLHQGPSWSCGVSHPDPGPRPSPRRCRNCQKGTAVGGLG